MRKQRGRRFWLIAALVFAVLAGGTGAALALHLSEPGVIPVAYGRAARPVVKSIFAAARGQRSVHWTGSGSYASNARSPGDYGPTGAYGPTGSAYGLTTWNRWRSTSDVTADSGVQRITMSFFRGAPVEAEIRLVGGIVYVKGNARALTWMKLGLTDAQASTYAGRWISLPKGLDPRTKFSAQLSLAELVDDLKQDLGSYWYGGRHPDYDGLSATMKPDGTQVVDWDPDAGDEDVPTSDLVAHIGSEPLPIAVNFDDEGWEHGGFQSRTSSSGHFSKWNEPVHVLAPKHAVPIATVRKS